MGKYTDIVNGSWVDMTLYAESIPHLLHWDLAYFWILEKDHLKPEVWEEKIEAWRYLLALFIIGELEIEDEPIHTPFLAHTQPYGINKVSWLRFRNTDQRVGVFSPTVLVRPLPDFKDADLRQWRRTVPDPFADRLHEVQHFASLIVRHLREGERGDTFKVRLADIVERELRPQAMANPPGGDFQSVQLLSRLFWSQEPDGPITEDVEIVVKRVGGGAQRAQLRTYIPYCSTCGRPLTVVAEAPPVVVTEEQFHVDCKNPECGETNTLDLSNFLIWLRSRNSVVVWQSQGLLTSLEKGYPPAPTIQNKIDVQFEWGPAQLGGERFRRYLRLRFPDKDITPHRYEEIFYPQLLIPGELEKFKGLPVRAQWIDALAATGYKIEPDAERRKVAYSGLVIKGWPQPMAWTAVNLKLDPDLAVGVYPDPLRMPDEWKLYRSFLAGETRRGYQLAVGGAREILPWLCEGEDGPPSHLSATDKARPDAGVTYWLDRASRPLLRRAARANIYVGLDLGTTNTLAYSMKEEEGERIEAVDPAVHGLRPSELHRDIGWLAESAGAKQAVTIGDFLPGPAYGQSDPYIIPSALWEFGPQERLIRWEAKPPVEGAQPKSDFKLAQGGDHFERRRAFANEVFWLVFPHVLLNEAAGAPASFRVGFAFPLAFDHRARKERLELMEGLGDRFGSSTYGFQFHATDESHACVRALGSPNPNDTFLVADMGGGTMDVALFRGSSVLGTGAGGDGQSPEELIHQIGSVEFAGGDFVRALVSKKYKDSEKGEQFRWELRDLITQGGCREQYGSDAVAQTVLRRLTGIAFEFLHTMILAQLERGQRGPIHLVLVGNGWHLVEAFNSTSRSKDERSIFNEYYGQNLIDKLNLQNSLQFYNPKSQLLRKLPSSKHLVVMGALYNVIDAQRTPDADSPSVTLSKLPAGRGLQIRLQDGSNRTKVVRWHDLVGEEVAWKEFTAQELHAGDFSFDFVNTPEETENWLRYLLGIFGAGARGSLPYPEQMTLKHAVSINIQGDPPKLLKGPLQLIVEGLWKEKLKD